MSFTYGFGRLIVPNYQNHLHPMAAALDPNEVVPNEKFYQTGPILDQGPRPECVAYAFEQFMVSDPNPESGVPDMDTIYLAAQARDTIPMPHDGTTVHAAADYLKEQGYLDAYLWASDVDTVARYILTRAPVVMGVTWYRSMLTPDGNGVLTLGGDSLGGHCTLLSGYSQSLRLFRVTNSWGPYWGDNGGAWLRHDDLTLLLRDYGELCSPIQAVRP